jgi:succinate dehydrogenase / fumarate reductase membrane anchor subunit
MNLRTPLARVRGLGSAKEGPRHWWAERLTALALIPLFLWFVAAVVSIGTADYAVAREWLRSPLNAALLLLLIVTMFHHAQLGMQVIFEDYVHTEWLKVTSIVLVRFTAITLAVVCVIAVLRVAMGG